ncbi:hypothetical protein BYT27DRAFT_7188333 [Phlegmacium glaucopus]|nr:hypothetical protein BYT27DRAFT_7188333 [Phlegmacium glaucopus]
MLISKLRRSGTNSKKSAIPALKNHLSDTEYARRCKLILELRSDIQKLDSSQVFKIDFPRLVVIGDQSSGKSSLVEAVSGINVPRDHGTCTRCPMECTMRSTTESWSCSISLKLGYDGLGARLESTTIIPFGLRIHDRSSVDLWIRRAQAAILSSRRDYREFYGKSEPELKNDDDPQRLQFSKNSVCIDIYDPESPNLDFVDLPGIVHAVDPPSLEDDIIDLVESFIKPKNTVILIAMPMTSDWQTQTAVRLAKAADPKGNRTIGILTKPDALQGGDIGSRETWKKILANEDPERKTKHGCYCVRLPNDLERSRGDARAKARNTEEDFFNSTAPWAQMKDKSRCGIPNFVKNISVLLVELIEEYLPDLVRIINQLLVDCIKKIAELPPVSDKAAATEILLRISAFCLAFKDAVFGLNHREFVQENKRRYARFSEDICLTEPRYITFKGEHNPAGTGPCLTLAEVREVKEKTITWELPPHVPFDATVKLIEMYTSKWEDPSLECFDDIVKNSIDFEETLLRSHFGHYGGLLSFVRQLTKKERGRCRDEARKILSKILQFESRPPFTQNEAFLNSERTKWLIKHDWEYYRLPNDTLKTYHYYRLRHEEHYQELELMADSYAYFQVAHKRIIDYVPLTIEHELNQTFVRNLQPLLFNSITRETPARLEELMQEDSDMESLRRSLESRKNELLKIKEKIGAFWSLDNAPSPSYSVETNVRPTRRSSSATTKSYHSVIAPSD